MSETAPKRHPVTAVNDLVKQLQIAVQDEIMHRAIKAVNDARNDIQLLLARIEPSTTSAQLVRSNIHVRFERLLKQLEAL